MRTENKTAISPVDNILIVAGNIVVIFGVLLWGWSLFDIFAIYWLENILIGAITIIRMLLCAAAWGIPFIIGSLFLICFFIFHYGIFCMGHGTIILSLFYDGAAPTSSGPLELFQFFLQIGGNNQFIFAMIGVVLIDSVRALQQIKSDRAEARMPKGIMFSPYGRIMVLHVTIIFGGLAAQELGDPIWALFLLVFFKTAYDLAAHNNLLRIHKPAARDTEDGEI